MSRATRSTGGGKALEGRPVGAVLFEMRKRPFDVRCDRLFVRGAVRQLGSPALLAASYSGNGAAVAAAAVQELGEALVGVAAAAATDHEDLVVFQESAHCFRCQVLVPHNL